MSGRWPAGIATLLLFVAGPIAGADEFQLANGGKLSGEWLNRDQTPRETYVIKTTHGQVTLPAQLVRKVVELSPVVAAYNRQLAQINDTVEDHWEMAERCRDAGLVQQREHHLEQILRHSPDHEKARHGLGFTKVSGRWLNTEQWRRDQGLVLYRGVWRVRQDIENELLQSQRADLEREWRAKIGRWRQTILKQNRRTPEALAGLAAVRHSRAVPALSQFLADKKEPRQMKLLYVDVLSNLPGPGATNALMKAYMEDSDELVRERCLDILSKWKSKRAVAFFTKQLASSDNGIVNHAGRALGALGDTSAVPDLISALVTKHKFKIGGSGISAGFGNGGNGGLNVSGRPKIVEREIPNRGVHSALLTLLPDSVNFEFDKPSWQRWYIDVHTPKNVELRRIK